MKELKEKYNFQSYLYNQDLDIEGHKLQERNCKNLLSILESIELIESTLTLYPSDSIERNAFILLNRQFIGAAQEKLSRVFTSKYPELAAIGFSNTVKEKNKSWFGHDRRAIAHQLDLNFLNDILDEQDLRDELTELKIVIINTLKKELNNEEFIQKLTEQKLNFDAKITNLIPANTIFSESSDHPLKNIQNILNELEFYLKSLSEKKFYSSYACQALIFLAEQAIGNNLNKYNSAKSEDKAIIDNIRGTRNRIAHSTLFRELIHNQENYWLLSEQNYQYKDFFYKKIDRMLGKTKDTLHPTDRLEPSDSAKNIEKVMNVLSNAVDNIDYLSVDNNKPDGKKKKNRLHQAPQKSYEHLNYTILTVQALLLKTGYLQIIEEIKELKNKRDAKDKLDINNHLDINHKFVFKKFKQYENNDKNIIVTYKLGDEAELDNPNDPLNSNKPLYVQYYFNKESEIPSTIEFDLLSYLVVSGSRNIEEIIRHLVNHGANINALVVNKDGDKHSLLHHAIMCNDLPLVKCLLENGVDYNLQDEFGLPPIWYAIEYGYENIAEELIKYGDDISKVAYLNLEYCRKKFPEVNFTTNELRPIFHHALKANEDLAMKMLKLFIVQRQDLQLAKGLLDQKVKYNANGEAWSVMDNLSYTSNDDIIQLIVDISKFWANREEKVELSKEVKQFISNLYEICKSPKNYELHNHVLLNNKNAVEEYLKGKSPAEVKKSLSKAIELPNSSRDEGYKVRELAQEMGYKELGAFLNEKATKAIRDSLYQGSGINMRR